MRQINWTIAGKHIVSAALIYILLVFLLSGLVGLVVKNEVMTPRMGGQAVSVVMAIGAFVMCLYCAKKVKHSRLVVALAAAAVAVMFLLLGKTFFFAEREVVFGWNFLALFLAGVMGGIVSSQKKPRR